MRVARSFRLSNIKYLIIMQLVLNIRIEKNNLKMFVKKRVTSSPLNFISREKCIIAMNYYIIRN